MTPSSSAFIVAAARRGSGCMLLAAALAGLGGCATGPNPRDPYEPFNRKMMEFNEGIDAVALKPAATVYREIFPPLIRTGVSNFFGNLGDAWSSINALLQLHLQDAAEDFMRFNVNTVFGLGGILDIASDLKIERHKEDFGQTLGRWGMPSGPYLVLPLLGSSTVRDALSLPIDLQGDPVHYVHPSSSRNSLYVLRAINTRSNLLRASSVLDQAALDKYSFARDAYLQRRQAQIFDSQKPDKFVKPPADSQGKEPDTDGKEPDTDGQIPPLPENTAPAPAAAQPAAR